MVGLWISSGRVDRWSIWTSNNNKRSVFITVKEEMRLGRLKIKGRRFLWVELPSRRCSFSAEDLPAVEL